MTFIKYILKSLKYYRKQHFAVFLGTLLSTAILTGALVVGDSVKYTLKNILAQRLGDVSYAMLTGERFVRAELSENIADELDTKTASVLMLPGIAINTTNKNRINTVQALGIDNKFWELSNKLMPELSAGEAIISDNIAKKLNLKINDEFLLRVQNAEIVPANAPFVNDNQASTALRLTIKAIADENNLAKFSLRNNQSAPFNVFISQDYLSEKLELIDLSNLILCSDANNIDEKTLNNALKKVWKISDASLSLNQLDSTEIFELSSSRIFIEQIFSEKIKEINIHQQPILTYFVNSIRTNNQETPYSFVAAISEVKSDSSTILDLQSNEIVINSWLADDLSINTGDTIELDYFVIGKLRTLEEKTTSFVIKKIIPMQNNLFDKTLMPSFPGLSDAGNCSDWETSIPIDLDKIRDKDEKYWEDYRGTPKAIISIENGLEMWENKFGNYTSIRFQQKNTNKEELEKLILEKINPNDINLSFQNVRLQGNNAAENGVDYGELFISLSFFIIVAALLLTILIYSIQTESRMSETGILFGLGFSRKKIISLRFSESLVTIFLGSIAGGFAGILYNKLLIYALNSVWNDAVNTNMLKVYSNPATIFIGILIGIIIALLSIYFVNRIKLRKQIITLIRKSVPVIKSRLKFNLAIAILGLSGSLFIIFYTLISSAEISPTLFLIAGALFLTGFTSLISFIINPSSKNRKKSVNNHANKTSIFRLAFKNTTRNKGRSIAVVVLLALGTFIIIVTGANRKTFVGTENLRQSGTGGFLFWVETTLPILHDLNTLDGKQKYNLESENILDSINFIQFHILAGDDASCLNLNQVQQPKILGVEPSDFDSRNAFSFAKLLNKTENPWLELNKSYGENIIPAIADQTVIQWGLLKKLGDTLYYASENGEEIKLLLVAGLNSSIFQGNILISDKMFMKHFPSSSGSKTMLIERTSCNLENDSCIESGIYELLNTYLSDYGIEIIFATERLSRFYSVSNTYLSVFMILGGLGIILGTFGLGIVFLRNMQDRKHELFLLNALGFQKNLIVKLVFLENLFLLISGIFTGIIAGIIGILPSLLSSAYNIPGGFMIILILLVFCNGLLWIYIPIFRISKFLLPV